MDQPEQERIFERLAVTTRDVELIDIAPWTTAGARSLITKSMRTLGGDLVDPVLQELPPHAEYRYRVLDGARRLTYLQKTGATTISAKIVPATTSDAAASAVTLVTNLARTTNAVKEALAFKALTDEGYTPQDISDLLGISKNLVNKRLRLLEVPTELLAGVKSGKIAPGVAHRVANLRPHEQKRLVKQYEKTGKLTGPDVANAQRAARKTLVAGMADSGVFQAPAPAPAAGGWIRRHLTAAREEGVPREDLLKLIDAIYEAEA